MIVYRIRPRPDKIDVGGVPNYYAIFKLESQAKLFGSHMWGKWCEIEPIEITDEIGGILFDE